MRSLERITIKNFKSIREQTLNLRRLNLFIGGNGAGKSNLIQAFRFLREVVQRNLAIYSLERGADNLIYFGSRVSKTMSFSLIFGESNTSHGYDITLSPTDEGGLVINSETVYSHHRTKYPEPYSTVINTGGRESALATSKMRIAQYVQRDLESYRLYHFHDTSDTSPIKAAGPLADNAFLRPDASNLAAFLYLLQEKSPDHYRNIEDTIRQTAPFFDRFNLAPSRLNSDRIRIEWQERGSDEYFNAAALSDGTLRFMCLSTLLLQPRLPALILLDEPELGLHPAAIALLAEMLSSASTRTQVLVATQSVTLVNQFAPEQIWTVDRADKQSVFSHLGKEDLTLWLSDYDSYEGYSLGELWEKNVLGARP